MKCGAVTARGRACQANAVTNSQFCFLHGDAERAKLLGARGGRNRAHIAPDLKRFPPPVTVNAIRDQTARCVQELRSGDLDAKLAQAIFTGMSILLRIVQAVDFETRLRRLEVAAAQRTKGR